MNNLASTGVLFTLAVSLTACSSSSSYDKAFSFKDPQQFNISTRTFDSNSAVITNPYLAFNVGRKTIFEGQTEDGLERIEIEVLAETKTIDGIECAIVLDRVSIDGSLIEETWDWYAEDVEGTVWYMGESSNDYEDGILISTHGSWEAGLDVVNLGKAAEAGIQMFANPVVGTAYYQEFYEGEAIDAAEVMQIDSKVTLADGSTVDAVKIKEWNPYDTSGFEYKYYVENIGLVRETNEEAAEAIVLISSVD